MQTIKTGNKTISAILTAGFNGKKGNGKNVPAPFKTDVGQDAIKVAMGYTTDLGIGTIVTNLDVLFSDSGLRITKITLKDVENPGLFITKVADQLMKSKDVTKYLTGLTQNVARDLCINAVMAAIITTDKNKVVPVCQFIQAQRQYFQAQGMVYNAQKLLNRLTVQGVRDSTVTIFQGGADGLIKMQEIAGKYPVICRFFKAIPVHAFPTDIQGVKILATMDPWVRGDAIIQLDNVVVKGLTDGNIRPGVSGKFIQKTLGINATGNTDDTTVTGPFLTPNQNTVGGGKDKTVTGNVNGGQINSPGAHA